MPPESRNWLYFVFCTSVPRQTVEEWEVNARRLIAEFRASLSDSLDSPWVMELVEGLKKESVEFESWWRDHDVRDNSPVVLQIQHPEMGSMAFERMVLNTADFQPMRILVLTPFK